MFACGAAFAVGCGDQAPEVFRPSHLQFSYSGAASGTYDATVQVPSVNASLTEWAYGQRVLSSGTLRITSQKLADAGKHYDLVFDIERLTEGSSTMNVCGPHACTVFWFTLGVPDTGEGFELFCELTAGTATLTEIEPTRARGTFSGTGTCSAMGDGQPEIPLTVTDGTFDVQLLADRP